ncbi:unnamed protein product [Arabidopsis thaliana]|uniref:Uncharacterized protein n=4 Tax=Arabidopsis TaxID=3701 RepID=A0A654ERM2_ARATH|nr:uncharacterized protein AT2G03565 [Arabidopsis thaliana]AEC05715.1 hypothetical protein AT2G03565 [Arabidopsis thaliana]KAG7640403.1 hypothetical protein ISN44_As02g002480 [Arabidopsis suecica]CAA0356342.1 unnamed protein product [Arabidopsis thaliana]VYS51934.1 unnamed protein product [Arabidopsis thaliana]|eukprot:NP_001154489.1 hypothetical protein AT2G03565 [Arabidopsis thaliana]
MEVINPTTLTFQELVLAKSHRLYAAAPLSSWIRRPIQREKRWDENCMKIKIGPNSVPIFCDRSSKD